MSLSEFRKQSQQPLSFWWTDVVIPKETIELQQCDEPPWSSGTFLTQTSLVINAQYYIEVEPVNRTSYIFQRKVNDILFWITHPCLFMIYTSFSIMLTNFSMMSVIFTRELASSAGLISKIHPHHHLNRDF